MGCGASLRSKPPSVGELRRARRAVSDPTTPHRRLSEALESEREMRAIRRANVAVCVSVVAVAALA